MSNKVYPIKIINKTFPITVADAVKIQGSNKNIINYVDETVNSLREYCNNDLQEGIKNYLRDIEKIDVVKDLGVIPEKNDETTRANNASLIKSKICESGRNFEGGIVLFFPSGTYHIDPIEFNEEFTEKSLTVFLVGENKGFNNYNILGNKGVQIYTYGNFMVRTNTEGSNASTFNASDLRFQQHDVSLLTQTAPHGILFGSTTNLGYEYNFHIYNCDIVGYEKALYSPGFSCGGTRVINSYFGLCKYGILIMSTCHTLSMDNVAFNVCYRGLTLLLGGDYCEIRHIHFDTSFHISYQAFLEEDSRCYGIYTTGGLAIDGIYTEQYNSQYNSGDNFIETPTTYTVIDYEGNNYSCGGKLLLKNASIGAPAASCKTFFRGANFQGPGLLKIDGSSITTSTPIRITHEMGLWQKGSVDFVRCNYSMQVLRESMDIYGGNDRAAGYVFDYRDVYGDGVAFTMHPIRGYKGSLIYNPDYILDHPKYIPTSITDYTERGAMFYNHRHYDPKVLTYKGCRLPSVDTLIHESTGDNTCHVKGNIYVNNIDNENVDVDVFIYFLPIIANTPFTKMKRIKLFSLNSSNINTDFTVPIDYTVSSLEYRAFMFGYEVKKDETFSTLTESEQMNYVLEKMLQVEDEKKIIYDYEYVWDEYGIVRRLDVQQIELSSSTLTLDDTTPTQQLTVTYYPTQTTQKGVEWTSSNDDVATVDADGNVTKVGVGKCVITATCNNTDYAHSAICNVTVSGEITPTKNLTSITAVYTQGDTIVYPNSSLDDLKQGLVVTATYSDSTSNAVTTYTLSGELTEGTSTITVTYSGKTTTFDVTVSEETSTEMDSAYSYLKVTVPASATPEQSTLYLSKPTGGIISSLYINGVPKDIPSGANHQTTSYSLNEGENIIKIKGNFTCWGSKCNINALQLQNDLTTCLGMFYECPNIVFDATIPSTVISTNSMFRGAGLVNGIDIPSSVTNTASMYQYAASLITPSTVPDSVIVCDNMYNGCTSLQGTVNVPNSATDITKYLQNAGTNGEGISVIGINISSVTNYSIAFYDAKITTIEQSFADLIMQAKPDTVTDAVCFRILDTYLSSPITIAEIHSDWKR